MATANTEDEESKRYGCFFAVLPKLPSISPSTLKHASELAVASSLNLEWTHDRVGELVHPQLPHPLKYLEISGILTLPQDADAEAACEDIAQLLLQQDPVGNAELLLVLADTPIPLLPTALPTADISTAKSVFDNYGLVSVQNVIQSPDLVELERCAMKEFERLHGGLLGRNDKKKHFKEIMGRDDNRFDFRLDCGECATDDDAWKRLGKTDGGWIPFVRTLLGEDCTLIRCGCVVSLPGTGVQYWHSDGVHVGESSTIDDADAAAPVHALCVFCPLIDLNESVGYTEFWAGSQKFSKLLAKKGEQTLPGGTKGILDRGSCLLYDYRTIHRGMPNSSEGSRPVCYFLYAKAGYEFVEDQNFKEESVFE
jgi:ectoine hydroxylase-related dioxygenase (phytanoyl-CoA dioxygenase family)